MTRWNPKRRSPGTMLAFALLIAAGGGRPAVGAPDAGFPAIPRADRDTTCAPCRDFYRFANGGWVDRNTIPAANSTWGSFEELAERNREVLRGLLERAAADKSAPPGSDAARLGDYWCACMDSQAVDAAGAKPIEPLLRRVDALAAPRGLAAEVARLHEDGVGGVFFFRVGQDPKHSEWQIAFAAQGGIGLPDRDYYTRTDSAAVETRRQYVDHVARSLELAGEPTERAQDQAGRILALETALANASMTAVQRRDPVATYHKIGVDSLRRLCPGFDWSAYLAGRRIARLDSINVTQPGFFQGVNGLIASVPLDDWKAYLRWKIVDDAAPMLSLAFADEDFRFARVLSGSETQQPRWKRCLGWVDRDLGDLLGKAYVAERFPESARQRALALVRNLEGALGGRIAELEWMDPETRRRALAKLEAFEANIGYPKTWRSYEGVKIDRTSLIASRRSARAYDVRRNLEKLGKPVDRGEWNMTPPTVNAFYSSSLNSINFPAGILQSPFFDASWDDAVNYGGIGAVIGHEMTHGFDDRGRQFDAEGNLRDWWTPQDAAQYKERASKVAQQFDRYTVLDTLHLNGRLTLGENIADLGGVAIAYVALQKALAEKGRPMIDGLTPEQRFFLSYGRIWANLTRPAAMRTRVQTNPHSPAQWRVNGPLSNLPEFAKTWGCRDGDAMVRPQEGRARIW